MNPIELIEIELKFFLSITDVLPNGQVIELRKLVDKVNDLKIEIYSNEHNPPHFHVKSNEFNASFNLLTCELISGTIDSKNIKKIEFYYSRHKDQLIKIWNDTRPTSSQPK